MTASPAPDPLAPFDGPPRPEDAVDPWPRLAACRARGAVHPGSPWDLLDDPLRMAPQGARVFTVLGHDVALRVLRDHHAFSSRAYAGTVGVSMGRTILEMDEPEHGPMREVVQRAFTRHALARWERELVRPVVEAHVARFAGRGRADLVRELCFPFPVAVIARMIGLPEERLEAFHGWALDLLRIGFDRERGLAARERLEEAFTALLAERRRDPGDDLLSVLATARREGAPLADEAIHAFLRLLLPAGAETTFRSLANLLFALLTHPAQLDALRRDPSLLPAALEEGLRWEPPILAVPRVALREVVLAGVAIPAGAWVFVALGAANRDPARHPDPDAFDLFRGGRAHLAFGSGVHRCLGMHLARSETRVALEVLLERLPDLRLDPDAPPPHVAGLALRSPPALPVRFTPRP